MASGATSPRGADGSVDSVADRDVLPGLERELSQIRGWLAMLEVRQGESEAVVIRKLELKQKYARVETAISVFKTALGPLHKPTAKPKPFSDLFRSDT